MPTIENVQLMVEKYLPSNEPVSSFIRWCSEVDALVKQRMNPEYSSATIELVEDQAAYDMPTGVALNRIVSLKINGYLYDKLDERTHEIAGYWLNSDGKIELYPVPSESDDSGDPSLRIVYRDAVTLYTAASQELDIDFPNDEIYHWYCMSKIALYDEDTIMHEVYQEKYRAAVSAYIALVRKNGPLDRGGKNKIVGPW